MILPEGALVGAVLASANRDPRRWTEPDRFDLHRKEGAHLAFAAGTHFCLGAWFGRYLARVSLDVLLDRLPGLGWIPRARSPCEDGSSVRPIRCGRDGIEEEEPTG